MEMAICQHRDQALLCALVTDAAQSVTFTKKGHVTRRALMTLFCYSKLAGVPTDRRFDIWPTGPVANEVLLDIEALELDEAIRDASIDPEKHADYVPAVGSFGLTVSHMRWLDEQRPKWKRVLAALTPLTNERLEQAAALHFLFLHLVKQGGVEGIFERTVTEFMAAAHGEGWKITAAEAIAFYDQLAAARIISG